jgi:hypothetical protein
MTWTLFRRKKMKADYWEAKRDGVVIGHGPKSTMPSAEERKQLRAGGLKIYVEGKLYREGKC